MRFPSPQFNHTSLLSHSRQAGMYQLPNPVVRKYSTVVLKSIFTVLISTVLMYTVPIVVQLPQVKILAYLIETVHFKRKYKKIFGRFFEIFRKFFKISGKYKYESGNFCYSSQSQFEKPFHFVLRISSDFLCWKNLMENSLQFSKYYLYSSVNTIHVN